MVLVLQSYMLQICSDEFKQSRVRRNIESRVAPVDPGLCRYKGLTVEWRNVALLMAAKTMELRQAQD